MMTNYLNSVEKYVYSEFFATLLEFKIIVNAIQITSIIPFFALYTWTYKVTLRPFGMHLGRSG